MAGPVPALSESRALRLFTFSALYVAQGLPWGFITVSYVVLLADLGLDNAEVGAAVGLAYLPWAFKVVWGPLLDAVPPLRIGRRRPFIIGSELLMGATLLALMWVDPRESLATVTLLLFLNNTFAALQDVAVDALAVDLLHEDERGTANSLMWAGKYLGIVAGGGGGTLLAKHLGWNALLLTMAIAVWAIMLLPLLLRERPRQPDDRRVDLGLLRLLWFLIPVSLVGLLMYALSEVEARHAEESWVAAVTVGKPFAAVAVALAAWPLVDRDGFRALRASFSFSVPWWGVLAALLTPAGYAMVTGIFTRIQRADLGLSEEQIATLSGVVEPIAGVVGALLGGVLADRLGVRRSIGGAMVALAGCLALWGLSPSLWTSWSFLLVWSAAFTGLTSAYNAATLGLFMSLANPRISATHFAIYVAATNVTYAWTAPLGGIVADEAGYTALFVAAAALQIVTIVLLWPLDTRRAARVYGR